MDNFLSPKEAVDKYTEGCGTKVSTPLGKLMVKAVMAGMMIAMGAAASSVAAHSISDVGVARLTAAVVFPVGLMMVILLGAELFTGDCLLILGTLSGKQKVSQIVRVLFFTFVGNFLGSLLMVLLTYASGQWDYTGGLLGAYTIKIAYGKANISFIKGISSGILCNILVCAAVLMALCAKDIAGKLLASFFVIMLFVTGGFEHCVANMYYISAGIAAKANPLYLQTAIEEYGYTAEQLASLNWQNFLIGNLIPVTIGNILGGMVFVGLPLFYVFQSKKAK